MIYKIATSLWKLRGEVFVTDYDIPSINYIKNRLKEVYISRNYNVLDIVYRNEEEIFEVKIDGDISKGGLDIDDENVATYFDGYMYYSLVAWQYSA